MLSSAVTIVIIVAIIFFSRCSRKAIIKLVGSLDESCYHLFTFQIHHVS